MSAAGAAARAARMPSACARFATWLARRASAGSRRPGACSPVRWPMNTKIHGSLSTIHVPTRSPRAPDDGLHVPRERLDHPAVRPAPAVLDPDRQVPVVERRVRLDPVRQQLVDQPAVVVEAPLVHRAAGVGEDPRPRDAEPVGTEAEAAQDRDVLGDAVVLVAGDVAVRAVRDGSRGVREAVPDRLALAVLAPRPLDLVRGRRGAPGEALGEAPGARHAILARPSSGARASSGVASRAASSSRSAGGPVSARSSQRSVSSAASPGSRTRSGPRTSSSR